MFGYKFQLCIVVFMFLSLNSLTAEFRFDPKWTNSKLGTTKYNSEKRVINEGKQDYAVAVKTGRKPLLCAVFMKATLHPAITFFANVFHTQGECDWAIVLYAGTLESERSICSHPKLNAVHCARAKDAINRNESDEKAIPKTVLYAELLPYLPLYNRVFLMDEDISLVDLDLKEMFRVWDCAFNNQPPPLIVQPVISQDTQYFQYVWIKSWHDTGVLASATGLVEQQVPIFDSIFFEWFVKRVLSHTRMYGLEYGVDWGHDRSWCNAAYMYGREVLKWPGGSVPCALITQHAVHHMNTHSMKNKRKNRENFLISGGKIVQKYIDLYPTWVLLDILAMPNPLHSKYGEGFKKSKVLNETCTRGWTWH